MSAGEQYTRSYLLDRVSTDVDDMHHSRQLLGLLLEVVLQALH